MEHVTRDIFEWTGRRELTDKEREHAKFLRESAKKFFGAKDDEEK